MADAEAIALDVAPDGARVEWDPDRLTALATPAPGQPAEPVWRLDVEPDWATIESLRLISAAFDDGRLLAVVALRPPDAEGHDETDVRGALVQANGEVVELAEALLSTEYDADGAPTRIGLELYTYADAIPLRVAADRAGDDSPHADGRRAIPMSFRLEGTSGAGLLEVVSRR